MNTDDGTPASNQCYDTRTVASQQVRDLAWSAIGLWVLVGVLIIWMLYELIRRGYASENAQQSAGEDASEDAGEFAGTAGANARLGGTLLL